MPPYSQDAAPPTVTVIVPCRNEAGCIDKVLESLLGSSYPRERLEAIFADGLSVDGTRQSLQRAAKEHPFIRVLDNPRLTAPSGLNLAARAARHDIVLRMDAHSEFPPDYIERCVRLLLSDPRIGSAGGRSVNIPGGDGPWAQAIAYVTAHRFGVGNVAYITSERPGAVDTVAFGCFRREVLEKVGLYDERLTRNQDNELHARLCKAGYVIAFDPSIVSFYRSRATLRALARQGFVTGLWNVYTLRVAPYSWKLRRFIPLAFVAYLALLALVCVLRPGWAAAAALPLAVYAALVAGFSLASGGHPADRCRVAATFVMYHLAYGSGPLAGVFNVLTGRWHADLGKPADTRGAAPGAV